MTLTEAVGAELRAERAAQRMTLDELARASGLSKPSVVRYLEGTRSMPVVALAWLTEALGTTPDAIVAKAAARLARG